MKHINFWAIVPIVACTIAIAAVVPGPRQIWSVVTMDSEQERQLLVSSKKGVTVETVDIDARRDTLHARLMEQCLEERAEYECIAMVGQAVKIAIP